MTLDIPTAPLPEDFQLDESFYLSRYPEVSEKIAHGTYRSALDHYERIGSALLMDPNEFFVSAYYLAQLDNARESALQLQGRQREQTLLWHYVTVGLTSGVEPVEFFDSGWYLKQYPDLEAALRTRRISSPLGHFLQYGSGENRDPGPGFACVAYLSAAPDARKLVERHEVRGAFGALVRLGGVEGRTAKVSSS